MPTYLVERSLPGAAMESWEAVRWAAAEACLAFVAEGKSVRYIRSTFTPGDSRCRCLFEASNADLVREVNDTAQIPYSRIILALEQPQEPSADLPP